MTVCVAYGCSNRTECKWPNTTFHSFPKDPDARRAWIIAVRRANWMPSNRSMLCSEHFTEDMFDRCSTMLVRLHKGAVPTVFKGFPKELQEKLSKRKPPQITIRKRKLVSKEIDVPKDINPPKYLRQASDNAPTKTFDMSLEIQRKMVLKLIHKKEGQAKLESLLAKEQKCLKKIKSLNELSAEQEKQIENMQELISNLKQEHFKQFEERQTFVLFDKKTES